TSKYDDIEEGDLPEHKRSPPPIDFSKVNPSKPEELLKMSKKGRTLMVFATVSGDPTEKETEEITGLWQGSLFNANFDIQRYFLSNLVSFFVSCFVSCHPVRVEGALKAHKCQLICRKWSTSGMFTKSSAAKLKCFL
uniref:LRP chaperone MESD n=1 Tax=Neolamprologus brichardi TaxID=32507 RepID=A0A3Q4G1Y1_NEOBR